MISGIISIPYLLHRRGVRLKAVYQGPIARVYIAMARGSSCIVPSEEETFPLPGITQQTGA